jgi:hypothetical protein
MRALAGDSTEETLPARKHAVFRAGNPDEQVDRFPRNRHKKRSAHWNVF